MRLSWPMPRRTSLMSAPIRSQRLAISLMKLIFVDSRALATYLVISALSGDIDQERLVGPQERLVQVAQHVDHLGAADADDHAVGLHEVVDRRAFLEELGIAGHVALAAGQLRVSRAIDLGVGADRHGALGDDDRVGRAGAGAMPSTTDQRAERSAEPSSPGGVPTARNTSFGRLDRGGQVGREVQPLGRDVALDQLGQARLVDRHLAAVEHVDLLLVAVDAGHVVAALGEAGAGDQADVAGANDGDFHERSAELTACPIRDCPSVLCAMEPNTP